MIKAKNGFKEYSENVKAICDKIAAIPDTGKDAKKVVAANYSSMMKPVFTLAGKTYLQSDFAKFFEGLTHGKLNGPHGAVVHDGYNMYVNNVVNDFEEHKLVEENPEFKNLMEEYRDGIMLFELMDRNVWGKASHDSEGLKKFFETRSDKYVWDPGFDGAVYKFRGKKAFDTGMMLLWDKTITDEQLVRKLNTTSNPDGATVQKGRFEFSHFKDATMEDLNRMTTKVIYPVGNSNVYTVVVCKQIHKEKENKTLDEARGYVVAEYQDFLEKDWDDKMKAEFPMKLNEAVFASLSKEKMPKVTPAPKGQSKK